MSASLPICVIAVGQFGRSVRDAARRLELDLDAQVIQLGSTEELGTVALPTSSRLRRSVLIADADLWNWSAETGSLLSRDSDFWEALGTGTWLGFLATRQIGRIETSLERPFLHLFESCADLPECLALLLSAILKGAVVTLPPVSRLLLDRIPPTPMGLRSAYAIRLAGRVSAKLLGDPQGDTAGVLRPAPARTMNPVADVAAAFFGGRIPARDVPDAAKDAVRRIVGEHGSRVGPQAVGTFDRLISEALVSGGIAGARAFLARQLSRALATTLQDGGMRDFQATAQSDAAVEAALCEISRRASSWALAMTATRRSALLSSLHDLAEAVSRPQPICNLLPNDGSLVSNLEAWWDRIDLVEERLIALTAQAANTQAIPLDQYLNSMCLGEEATIEEILNEEAFRDVVMSETLPGRLRLRCSHYFWGVRDRDPEPLGAQAEAKSNPATRPLVLGTPEFLSSQTALAAAGRFGANCQAVARTTVLCGENVLLVSVQPLLDSHPTIEEHRSSATRTKILRSELRASLTAYCPAEMAAEAEVWSRVRRVWLSPRLAPSNPANSLEELWEGQTRLQDDQTALAWCQAHREALNRWVWDTRFAGLRAALPADRLDLPCQNLERAFAEAPIFRMEGGPRVTPDFGCPMEDGSMAAMRHYSEVVVSTASLSVELLVFFAPAIAAEGSQWPLIDGRSREGEEWLRAHQHEIKVSSPIYPFTDRLELAWTQAWRWEDELATFENLRDRPAAAFAHRPLFCPVLWLTEVIDSHSSYEAHAPVPVDPVAEVASLLAVALATHLITHVGGYLAYTNTEGNGLLYTAYLAPADDPAMAITGLLEQRELLPTLRRDVRARVADLCYRDAIKSYAHDLGAEVATRDWLQLPVTPHQRLLAEQGKAIAARLSPVPAGTIVEIREPPVDIGWDSGIVLPGLNTLTLNEWEP